MVVLLAALHMKPLKKRYPQNTSEQNCRHRTSLVGLPLPGCRCEAAQRLAKQSTKATRYCGDCLERTTQVVSEPCKVCPLRLWMVAKSISHHYEAMGTRCLLVFLGESSETRVSCCRISSMQSIMQACPGMSSQRCRPSSSTSQASQAALNPAFFQQNYSILDGAHCLQEGCTSRFPKS